MKPIFLSGVIFLSLFSFSVFAASKVTHNPKQKQHNIPAINLNNASVSELKHAYQGIDLRRAKAIIAYRSKHGPFQSVAELCKVRQLGKVYIKRNLKALEKVFTVK